MDELVHRALIEVCGGGPWARSVCEQARVKGGGRHVALRRGGGHRKADSRGGLAGGGSGDLETSAPQTLFWMIFRGGGGDAGRGGEDRGEKRITLVSSYGVVRDFTLHQLAVRIMEVIGDIAKDAGGVPLLSNIMLAPKQPPKLKKNKKKEKGGKETLKQNEGSNQPEGANGEACERRGGARW